jgi:hypothetical protein
MARTRLQIQATAEQVACVRGREDSAQRGEFRRPRLKRSHATLIMPFVGGKEKRAVSADGAANRTAEQPPPERQIVAARIAAQAGIGRQVVIAIPEESGAVRLIPARAGHHVDRSNGCEAAGNVEIHR